MLIGFHFGHLLDREGDHVRDQLHRGPGRERVGPARQVLLDDVVLGGALELGAVDAVVLRRDDVERQQPGRRRVDRHRRVHLVERDAVEQRGHVALVGDGDPDLADLAARELVVGVVARLRGQVEGDRQAGLALGEVRAVQLVGLLRRRVTGVGAHHPRPIGLLQARAPWRHYLRSLDAGHRHRAPRRERVIGCWELDGVLVDPGPESTLDTLLAGLGEGFEPRAVLLTHIHFDHAGATGALVERWPDLPGVRPRGRRAAPHRPRAPRPLRHPPVRRGRTCSACGARSMPVPEANLQRAVRRRDGARATSRSSTRPATPPTTSAYLHEPTGTAFVGDVAGVRIPPATLVVAPTPPPDIDVDAWNASLDLLAGWRPQRLALTHFGVRSTRTSRATSTRCAPRSPSRSSASGRLTQEEFVASQIALLEESMDLETAKAVRAGAAAAPHLARPGPLALEQAGRHEPDDRAAPRRRAGLRARRRLARDRPQRRSQHLRPRRHDARPLHPGHDARRGLRDGRPHPQHRPRDRLDRASRSRPSSTGSSSRTPG